MLRHAISAVILTAALAACGGKGIEDPANELPWGHVDTPAAGAQVKGGTAIGGWALDDRGVKQIRIYVDNHLAYTGTLTVDRPDVSKANPLYTRSDHKHGFNLFAPIDAPGPHTIIVQAVDTDGATRDIAVIPVTAVEK